MKSRSQAAGDLVGVIGAAMIVVGISITAGCEPLVQNDPGPATAPTVVTITNATPGVYIVSGDGSVITVGDENEIGIAPDQSTDNSVRENAP
jgi:hypothetical protein